MTVRQISGDHRTVVEVLRSAAENHGDTEAYVEPAASLALAASPTLSDSPASRRHLTFAEWDRAADGAAGLLAGHGVGRGSVVCLYLPSSIDYMIGYAAAVRLGAVASGINPRLGPGEVTSILHRTRPAVTLVDGGLRLPDGPAGRVVDRRTLAEATSGPPPARFPVLDPTDPVAVVWTSGTTGLPKGAVFDHDNLRAVAAGTDVLSQPGDRRLSPLPFAHVGSMTRLWDEAAHAVTTVITPSPWRAAEAVAVMVAERITVAQGVPTQWALVLAEPGLDDADLSALRIVGTGASRVPPELVEAMGRRFGVPVVVRYTTTEASLGTGTRPGDPPAVVATTVGRPVPGVELEITDDGGHPSGTGDVGRVRLRSGAVMRGYWAGPPTGPGRAGAQLDDAATGSVLDGEGWLTTGDFGFVDADGNLHLVGRANELYIRGGYNVYPAEVEDVLGRHPDVDAVAVLGLPDPVLGEVGVAAVVLTPGAPSDPDRLLAELRDLVRGSLADYKAPDRLVVTDALPLTPMMKVDKRVLRARLTEGLAVATDPATSGARAR
jgi:acyl-CoA synthetase (AMP-forming)/AMP-acid ligase II